MHWPCNWQIIKNAVIGLAEVSSLFQQGYLKVTVLRCSPGLLLDSLTWPRVKVIGEGYFVHYNQSIKTLIDAITYRRASQRLLDGRISRKRITSIMGCQFWG